MGDCETVAKCGSRCALLIYLFVAGPALLSFPTAHAQALASGCAHPVARVVALQGDVRLRQEEGKEWLPVTRLDTSLCTGDHLRTDALSRAALFVHPETVIRVNQNTVITLNQSADEITVEFCRDAPADPASGAASCGAGYFITRFPKKFQVKTPHMNAAVEGTEFMIAASRDESQLTVLEGTVASEAVATGERRLVEAGQSIANGTGGAGTISAVMKPEDAVQWVLRYPPLSEGADASRAEDLLRAGSVDDALAEIDSILRDNRDDSDALALRSIIKTAKNDKAGALESANEATVAGPGNYRAWLALSYVQQAGFDLEAALESSQRAASIAADNSLAQARVAELLLSLGDVRRAEEAARAAVASNSASSHAQSVLGFVYLAQIDTTAAEAAFRAALEWDSFSSFARLGLGLAVIRDGYLVAGREQLEIAVALDPSNALLRSYVGKAYYEENIPERNNLAVTQFQLAGQLDPLDPTPHFYDAILQQSLNRPVDALAGFNAAIERNSNRAVYRSKLLLDDDAASQGATIASIYGELGLERLDMLESAKALLENAANFSAHRQLAQAYANLPRHDIARVSEALQAQIRQPVSIAPVPTLLGTDSLLVLKDVGPSQLGTNEFNQLFNSDGVEAIAEAVGGSRDSLGGHVVMSGLDEHIAYSASAMNYKSDGFIRNDTAEKTVYDVFVQGQLRAGSTLQSEAKYSEIEVGQTFAAFSPMFAEAVTIAERSKSLRISGNERATPRLDWIWTAVYEDRQREVLSLPDPFLLTGHDADTFAVELQNAMQVGAWQLVTGAGYVEERDSFISGIEVTIEAADVYAYSQWHSSHRQLALQLGVAFDAYLQKNSAFDDRIERERLNPRFGLVWSPMLGTTFRAAVASTLKRPLVGGQTIEPTQVAGFNQYFTGFERIYGEPTGTVSERVGVAIDQVVTNNLRAGIELSRRDLDVARLGDRTAWDERSALAYLYGTFAGNRWQGVMSLDAEYEEYDRPPLDTGSEGFLDLKTIRVPLGVRFFDEDGWTLRAAVTYVEQTGRFAESLGDPIVIKDDDGVIVDVALEYELPRRRGRIAAGVNNLFDEFVDVIEIDPLNPRIALRQLAFLRVRVDF